MNFTGLWFGILLHPVLTPSHFLLFFTFTACEEIVNVNFFNFLVFSLSLLAKNIATVRSAFFVTPSKNVHWQGFFPRMELLGVQGI